MHVSTADHVSSLEEVRETLKVAEGHKEKGEYATYLKTLEEGVEQYSSSQVLLTINSIYTLSPVTGVAFGAD